MIQTRYTMSARSQGKLYAQRQQASLAEKDVHRWVFVYNMEPDVGTLVRKWLTTRLDNFYCDLRVMYMPHVIGPTLARTHIVLNNTPPLHTMAENDEGRRPWLDPEGCCGGLHVVRGVLGRGVWPAHPLRICEVS